MAHGGVNIRMLFREMTMEDYEEAYDLWLNTKGIGLSRSDSKEEIGKFLARNEGCSFVCVDQGKVIGTVLCGHDGRRGFLYHVAVREEYRGRSIGQELVRRSLEQLKKHGIAKCHLMVMADNDLGHRFWSRIGWQRRSDIDLFSKDT